MTQDIATTADPSQGYTIIAAPTPPTTLRRTGIGALDDLLGGGFDPGSVWSIEGAPGAGKTLLALHFLAQGISEGEPGLYITVSEPPAKIAQFLARHWPRLEAAVTQRQLAILDPSPFFTELRLAKSRRAKGQGDAWDEIWRFVQDATKQSRNMGAQRIVIDPLTPLLLANDSAIDLWDITQTLVAALGENRGATTLVTHVALEQSGFTAIGATLRALCTGVLQMQTQHDLAGRAQLGIQAIKRRYAPVAGHEVSVTIGVGGHARPREPNTRPLGEHVA
jgi:circadian clock protein KaiC